MPLPAAHAPLLTIARDEFETATLGRRWLPLEDQDDPKVIGKRLLSDRDCLAPHGIILGDVGSLYLFTCTGCADRPLAGTMQAGPRQSAGLSGW